MDTLKQLRSELEQEYGTTKKFFDVYPEDKPGYQPHEKSMKLSVLAGHVAEIFGWPDFMLKTEVLDFARGGYKPVTITSRQLLLEELDKNYEASSAALGNAAEADLEPTWALANDGHKLAEWTKYEAIRHALSQITHHRAQLGVYYRLNDIPLPGSYGPSADTQQF